MKKHINISASATWIRQFKPVLYKSNNVQKQQRKKKCIPLDPLAFFILHEKSDKYKWGRKYPFSPVKEDKLDMGSMHLFDCLTDGNSCPTIPGMVQKGTVAREFTTIIYL